MADTGAASRIPDDRDDSGGVTPKAPQPGRTARSLDGLIHQRTRLGIVSALAVNEKLSFTELKQAIRTTDGNLSVHARKLEEAGYVVCTKRFSGRTPLTEYALTKQGQAALEEYLEHMQTLIEATRNTP